MNARQFSHASTKNASILAEVHAVLTLGVRSSITVQSVVVHQIRLAIHSLVAMLHHHQLKESMIMCHAILVNHLHAVLTLYAKLWAIVHLANACLSSSVHLQIADRNVSSIRIVSRPKPVSTTNAKILALAHVEQMLSAVS